MRAPVTIAIEEELADAETIGDRVVTTAEVAECTCPEPCERDHDRD